MDAFIYGSLVVVLLACPCLSTYLLAKLGTIPHGPTVHTPPNLGIGLVTEMLALNHEDVIVCMALCKILDRV